MCHRYERENRGRRFLSLERALVMMSYIAADGTRARDSDQQEARQPAHDQRAIRHGHQPGQKINDELEGDKGLDLARRLMMEDKSR